ncbi:hypothetical protein FKM82_016619 [Ascaphus truei]
MSLFPLTGLSQHVVTEYEQVVALLEEGVENRITAATHIHDASSRSHAIFTIQYTQAMMEDNLPSELASKINLVDLAGSERASPSYCKDRLTEGSNINRSLVTLGIVISALAQNSQMSSSCQSINSIASDGDSGSPGSLKRQPYIPYRDSILTWLLKDSLGGNSKTIMIATVSPASGSYNETMSTLRYASNAKNIINKPRVNEDANVKLIRDLREEIDRLKNMLRSIEMRTFSPSFSDDKDGNLTELVLQNELKIEQLTKDWTDKWTDKEAIMEQYNVDINKGKAGVTIDSNLPHLIAMDDDILSTGVVIYHLKEGTTKIGRGDSDQDIVLQGEWIAVEHCVIDNSGGVVVLRAVPGAHCTVDGLEVADACRLSQGAVLVFGKTNRFRFNHPAEAAILRQRRTESQASFLSSGSLDWLDLSGAFSTSSNGNSLMSNARKTDPLSEEYQQKLRDLEAFYQQQVDEQQRYVEDLKRQIQTAQVKGEKELEHEQSLINQLIKENQQWLVKEEQRLTTSQQQRRESAAQTEPKSYAEAEVHKTLPADIHPSPAEQDRKRLVQLELLRKCSLRRAERNIKRKRVKFQLERVVKKQKLLEAKKDLQQLQAVCWINEDRVKQIYPHNPNTREPSLTTLRRSRSSPSGFVYSRKCALPWSVQPLPNYRKGKPELAATVHSCKPPQDHKPRRSVSIECLTKACNGSRRGDTDYEQTSVLTATLQGDEKHTKESVANQNKTRTCCGVTLLIGYPQMSKKHKNMDKAGNRSKLLSNNFPDEPSKKKNVRASVAAGSRETKAKPLKGLRQQQTVRSINKSCVQELNKMSQKNEVSKCPSETSTKKTQKSAAIGKLPFGHSSSTVQTVKRETASSVPCTQKKSNDVFAKLSSSVDNINRLSSRVPTHAIDRRCQSTERLSRGLLKPTTEILENWKEDGESGSSDSESFYSVDSLSSAYASALHEPLKPEELERSKNIANQKDSDSEDSQMSQDSLVGRENRKERPNKRQFNKYKTLKAPNSSCKVLTEQNVLPIMPGSLTTGLSKSFSLDSLADAEEVPEADSSEEMPAEIFWKLPSPRILVRHTEGPHKVEITDGGDGSGEGISSSFYLNVNQESGSDYNSTSSVRRMGDCPRASTNICDAKCGKLGRNSPVLTSACSSIEQENENCSPQMVSPKAFITKSVSDPEPFKEQVKRKHSSVEITEENVSINILLLNKDLESQEPESTCDIKESTSEKTGNSCDFLPVAADPSFRHTPNLSHSDTEFTSVNDEFDVHTPLSDMFKNHHSCQTKSQRCRTEDDNVIVAADCRRLPATCDEDIFSSTGESCGKEAGTESVPTTCEGIPSTHCHVNTVNVNKSLGEIPLIRREYTEQSSVCQQLSSNEMYSDSITPLNQKVGEYETKELFPLPRSRGKSETCHNSFDAACLDQNKNIEPEIPLTMPVCMLQFQGSPCSNSALESQSVDYQESPIHFTDMSLLNSDAENNGNDKAGNHSSSCDFEILTPPHGPVTSRSQLDINANKEFSDAVCEVTCQSEEETHTASNIISYDSKNENGDNPVPNQNTTGNNGVVTNSQSVLRSVAKSGVFIGSRQSSEQRDINPPVFTDQVDASRVSSQTEYNSFPETTEKRENASLLPLFIINNNNNYPNGSALSEAVFLSAASNCGSEQTEATEIHVHATEAPLSVRETSALLINSTHVITEEANCDIPGCISSENSSGNSGKVDMYEMNRTFASSSLVLNDDLTKCVHLKAAEKEKDEEIESATNVGNKNIVSNLTANSNSLHRSAIFNDILDLNSSAIDAGNCSLSLNNVEINTVVTFQGPSSPKDVVNICVPPNCTVDLGVGEGFHDTLNIKTIARAQGNGAVDNSFDELNDRASMQNAIDLVKNGGVLSKERRTKVNVLYGEAIALPETCTEKASVITSEKEIESSQTKSFGYTPEEGITSDQRGTGTSKVITNNNYVLSMECTDVPDKISIFYPDSMEILPSLPETPSASAGSEEKSIVDGRKSVGAESTLIALKEHSTLEGSTVSLFSSRTIGYQGWARCGFHDQTDIARSLEYMLELHNESDLFDKDDGRTEMCSNNQKHGDGKKLNVEVLGNESSRTQDALPITENNFLLRGKLHIPVYHDQLENSSHSRNTLEGIYTNEDCPSSIQNSNPANFPHKKNGIKYVPVTDHNEPGDNANAFYLGINSRSSSLQQNPGCVNIRTAEDIGGTGLVLPYYEAIMQNQLLCETMHSKDKKLRSKSSPRNKKSVFLKTAIHPKKIREECSGKSGLNTLNLAGVKPLQKNTRADNLREPVTVCSTSELTMFKNAGMFLEQQDKKSEHNVLHGAENLQPDKPGIMTNAEGFEECSSLSPPKLHALFHYPTEHLSKALTSGKLQVGPNIRGKLKYFQSKSDNVSMLYHSACEQLDKNVCCDVSETQGNKIQDVNISVTETRKELPNKKQKSEGPLADIVNEHRDALLGGKSLGMEEMGCLGYSQGSAYLLHNPKSMQNRDKEDYSILTCSINDNSLQLSAPRGQCTSDQCCISSSNLQEFSLPLDNQLLQENQQETDSKVDNSCADRFSNTPVMINNIELISTQLNDVRAVGTKYKEQNNVTAENEVMPKVSSEEFHPGVGTLDTLPPQTEHIEASNCVARNVHLHIVGKAVGEGQIQGGCVVDIPVDKYTRAERSGEVNVPTAPVVGLNNYHQSAYLKVGSSNVKMSDAVCTCCTKDHYPTHTQDHRSSAPSVADISNLGHFSFSISSKSLQNLTVQSPPLNADNVFNIERRPTSNPHDIAHAKSKLIHPRAPHLATDNKDHHCHLNSFANSPTETSIDPHFNTLLVNPYHYKHMDVKTDVTNRAPTKYISNTFKEQAHQAVQSDLELVDNKEGLHFSSSDINPFVHLWQPEENSKVSGRQYAFGSASDVSCSKLLARLEDDKVMRCSSVDEGLNSHNSPFHSHLSSYANAREISSTLSSSEDFHTLGDTMQDFKPANSLACAQYYYPLSSTTIAVNSKDTEPQIGSSSSVEPRSENCSMQVDEIMLLYTSESQSCNEKHIKITCEQATQTKARHNRLNRHRRSHTDVSSVKPTKSRNLHQRPASWTSVQNMSLHLSQLLHETSELLGTLSQHHTVDIHQDTVNQQVETVGKSPVTHISTQTTVDLGIQTDVQACIQTKHEDVEYQAKERSHFLNPSEINVIVKVIGTNSLPLTQQQNPDIKLKENDQETPSTKTQSLPNLHDFLSSEISQDVLCPSSPVRASTPILADLQETTSNKSFSPFITSVSPISPISDMAKGDSSCTVVSGAASSTDGKLSCHTEPMGTIEELNEKLMCRGNAIMVDRASSPILTLRASKMPLNTIIKPQSLNSQNILKLLRQRRKKGCGIHEPLMDNSSQSETDSECASSHGSSKIVKTSELLSCSPVKESLVRDDSEDAKLVHRFRSDNCIPKEVHPLAPNCSSSILDLAQKKVDGTSPTPLIPKKHYGGQPLANRISQSSSPSKEDRDDDNNCGSFTLTSNNSFLKHKNYPFSASETSGFDLRFQDEDEASIVESECNTEVLLNQDPSISVSLRLQSYSLQDLPLHNKFNNWSGVQCSLPAVTGSLLGSAADLSLGKSPSQTEASRICESRAREIERLQRERVEIMSGIHLEMNQQPLTVQLAEAKLNYGIGETDALLRVIQTGTVHKQDAVSIKKQLYDGHMKAIESLRKEREERLQCFRRSRSLSPQKQLSVSQGSLASLRESDLPSRRREYLQQLRKNVVDNTRVQEPRRRTAQCPSEIELLLKDYQKAREEAKTEIARARDKLRERAEVEKRRLQQSCQPRDDIKPKTRLSTSTLCTSSSVSSGPTSGYNSSITATSGKRKLGSLEAKTSPRSSDLPSAATRGRSAVRTCHLAPSQKTSASELVAVSRAPAEESWVVDSPPTSANINPCYIPYNSTLPSPTASYQEFTRQVQASATAEVSFKRFQMFWCLCL